MARASANPGEGPEQSGGVDGGASLAVAGDHVRLNRDVEDERGLIARGTWGVVEFIVASHVRVDFAGVRTAVPPAAIDLVVPRCPDHPGIDPKCARCQSIHSERRRAARVQSQPGVTVPTRLLGALLHRAGPGLMARARESLGLGTVVGLERKLRE
ncbi:hypothetical protein SEA_VANLEE_43 [Gordonia phage VanLee]|uniref:Uncharacterized protein n=1 Tax=Gordonia phage VanLee TaxID=2845816 RepID=A0A8F2D9D5_9CAUD|nr:hypothetical protein QEH49_gp043 [Gordonia phage VanLee]QWS68160.1 hypothetical protein SEA_VANLEE_43 [Gordonia phage VanLee]